MAGHSKWANIKHKKGAADAKRGKLFTKLAREVEVASRMGGGDITANPRLRDAIAEARSNNVPKANIERAIKRGTGEIEGKVYEEVVYEGYGPGGVAILIEGMTDNRNRTVADIRSLLSKNGGSLGESGSVAWMFEKKGLIAVEKKQADEDKITEAALEAGAEDVQDEGDIWEVVTELTDFSSVKSAVEEQGIAIASASLSAIPKTTVQIEGDAAVKMIRLMDLLEDHDDVQKVYANFDIDDAELEKLEL